MTKKRINRWVGAAVGIALASIGANASAAGRTDLAHLHPGNPSKMPIGWALFCQATPAECRPAKPVPRPAFTDARWRELVEVNLFYNRLIEPMTDQDQFGVAENWTYATTGKGDCEDYVLEKRRELARRGWPMSALLITVVYDKQGGGHAVLTVTTDRGDFILDNQTDKVLPWSKSELTFVKRQAPDDPNTWLDLGKLVGRPDLVTAGMR